MHEVRRELHEQGALEQRLAYEAEVEVLEITEAAVNELRRTRRRAGREVLALHERHAVATRRSVERDSRAGYPAADHDHVEAL